MAYPGTGDGVIVDIADVPDFHEVRTDRNGVHIGAFADIERIKEEPLIRTALGSSPFGAATARFRLAALGANVVIAGVGATRNTPLTGLEAHRIPANEIPLAVTLGTNLPQVSFGDRRLQRRDGRASIDLHVFVALTLSGYHRIGIANVAYAVDGGEPIPFTAVSATLCGAMIGRSTFAEAARQAADIFEGDDERTNVLRRTVIPLLLSAFKDAYADARGMAPKAGR